MRARSASSYPRREGGRRRARGRPGRTRRRRAAAAQLGEPSTTAARRPSAADRARPWRRAAARARRGRTLGEPARNRSTRAVSARAPTHSARFSPACSVARASDSTVVMRTRRRSGRRAPRRTGRLRRRGRGAASGSKRSPSTQVLHGTGERRGRDAVHLPEAVAVDAELAVADALLDGRARAVRHPLAVDHRVAGSPTLGATRSTARAPGNRASSGARSRRARARRAGTDATGMTVWLRAAYGPTAPSSSTWRLTRVRQPVPSGVSPGASAGSTGADLDVDVDAADAREGVASTSRLQRALVREADVAEVGAAGAAPGARSMAASAQTCGCRCGEARRTSSASARQNRSCRRR